MAHAFILGRDFIGSRPSALVLGDSIFHGHDWQALLVHTARRSVEPTVFAYHVNDLQRYGVAEFDAERRAVSIEEKPRGRRVLAPSRAYILMMRTCATSRLRSNPAPAASWRSPI